jgi:hypothetical protein
MEVKMKNVHDLRDDLYGIAEEIAIQAIQGYRERSSCGTIPEADCILQAEDTAIEAGWEKLERILKGVI